MTLNELTYRFTGIKKISESSYQCKCPVHDDKTASLTISDSKGTLLLHCHAGCETQDILTSVGLTYGDINNKPAAKAFTWKERLEYGKKKRLEAIYDYCNEKGMYLYSKVRFEGKEIVYMVIDKVNDRYEYGAKGKDKTLYHLPLLLKGVKDGRRVYITEGEKDADTLKEMGYIATTAGGVDDWKKEYASYFTGAKVVILPDNDKSGLKLKDQIIRDLKNYAHSIRWTITSKAEKGDVTDYLLKEKHSKEELDQLVNETENIGAPWIYMTGKEGQKVMKINGDILADCISRTLSYLIVRRPEDDKDDLYVYENGVYGKCNKNKFKTFVRKYIPIGLANDNMLNNTVNLLLCNETNICKFQELDTSETYINVRNGLYNIKSKVLEKHTPKLYSTIQLKCDYDPADLYMPVFTKYINELCSDTEGNLDHSKKAVLQEFIGLLLSNVKVSRVKACLVLYSLLGNSGKTQILNLIGELLGTDKTINIPIQNMNEDSKFSLGSICGKRLISIGDQKGSDIEDSSIFKQLTGGDPIKVEPKHKQPFSFIFNGGILIACNNLPNFKDDKGGHVFERMCIVPCINTIEADKRDSALLDKMLKERNAILNWFLEGLHRLINNNYRFSKSVASNEAMHEYRNKLDTVYRYLDEFYIITEDKMDRILKSKFETDYIKWCEENGYKSVNKQNIRDRMEKNGIREKKANIENQRGVYVYQNIKFKVGDFKLALKKEIEQAELVFR